MNKDTPHLIPLTGNAGKAPVLLLDGNCSYNDLQDCADMRLSAAKDMLRSLSLLDSSEADGRDLQNFAHAAAVLLEDASDLLAAARQAVRRGLS
ncbi:hypothetical protein [Pseudomonas sp. BN515]|uniref:hypothetical protein n=1 Tax=Pseudomonas sp. BN515 TaxID=2567892 RepID=UPI002458F507|nr:hypothetical protein [Pseudomonas sp. BN515]MDH4873587.1 hypothetical protein [Pseudomonas sp. BN515]